MPGEPTLVQLWPERFDVACTISEVNIGGSPGDADHPEPYLYVGPWTLRSGPFWNESWGASKSWRAVPDAPAAVEFLEDGLRRAAQVPSPKQSAHLHAVPSTSRLRSWSGLVGNASRRVPTCRKDLRSERVSR